MPSSVYSSTGHGVMSRLNPIKLVTRFVAIAMVMSIALLGTAQLAGAIGPTSTTASAVAATTTHPRAAEVGTSWVIGFTPAATLAATDVIVVTLPTGTTFVSPTTTTYTGGLGGTCVLAVSATANVANVTITSCTTMPAGATAAGFTITGVTNPAVGSYSPTVGINAGAATAATAAQVIYAGAATALATPTVSNAGNGLATVSFVPDGTPVGVTATYNVTATPPSGVLFTSGCGTAGAITNPGTTAAQTCSVSGLTVGTSYTFTVTPTSGTDPATAKTTAPFVASSALATPVATQAGSGSANVQFTGDGVANHYVVTSTPGGFTCVVSSGTSLSGSQTCTVSGLTNGTSYTFTVTPTGFSTTSTVSAASNAIIPGAALAKPTVALAGSGNINVAFVADGVATLYTVSINSQTSGTLTATCQVGNTQTPPTGAQNCTVTGLANGVTYTFVVTPSGNSTSSSVSPASATIVAGTALNVPTTVSAGGDAIKVSFVADGVASTYTVTIATQSSGALTNNCIYSNTTTAPTGPQSCTVTGLTNGVTYTFVVTPTGNTTSSTVSGPSTPGVMASTALATPTVANAGAGAVKVSFVADGAATTYTVSIASQSSGTLTSTCVVANTTTPPTGAQSCTVTGLASAVAYTFIVTPTGGTASPASTVSLASSSITTVSPITLTSVTGGGNGAAVVHFTADGVATTYVVTSTPGSFSCTVTNGTTAVTAGAQSCTVTGLTNGTSYTFTVTPSGNSTTSVVSAASSAFIAGSSLATPTVAAAGSGSVLVSFAADGVSSTYTVSIASQSAGALTVGCVVANTTTAPTGAQSCTVHGLTNGVTYTFLVTPSGNSTPSGASAASASVIATAALATPTTANAGTGAIKVSFVADGNATVYTVSIASQTSGALTSTCVVTNTTTPLTGAQNCTVSGLTNGVSYTFIVTPTGGASASPSTVSLASTPAIMAGVNFLAAPTVAYAASGAALVSFVADGVASTYVVTSTGGQTCTVVNSTTAPTGAQHCIVTGLTLGTSYTFHVVPSGNATTSLQSPESAAFVAIAAVAPAAPTATATGGALSVVVTWVAPTNTGGSAITGYVVSATAGNTTTTCGTVAATATTCTITGLLAGTAYAVSVAAVNALGTSPAATATATTNAAVTPPPAVRFTLGAVHGYAVHGRTVTITMSGTGFQGQPRITSTGAGVRAVVSHDNGTLITIRVTTPARVRGMHVFTVTLANGKSAKRAYLTK